MRRNRQAPWVGHFLVAAVGIGLAWPAQAEEGLQLRLSRFVDQLQQPIELAQVQEEPQDDPGRSSGSQDDDYPPKLDDSSPTFGDVDLGTSQVGEKGAAPQGKRFGIGVQLGVPVALTLKFMILPDQAIQAGIGGGWAFDDPFLSLHLDYVWHPHVLATAEAFNLTWYFGGGLWVWGFANPESAPFLFRLTYPPIQNTGSQIWFAARVPVGLNLAFTDLPLEAYLELAPALVLFPQVTLWPGGVVGARFYF